jgi:hypothetical protein
MPDRFRELQTLNVGDVAGLPVRVTAKSGAGVTLAPVARDAAGALVENGAFSVAAAGGVSGPGWTTDPKLQPMLVIGRQLVAGDLLLGADGQVTMVRAAGLGPDASWWSPYPDGHGAQPQDGFVLAGHATPPP